MSIRLEKGQAKDGGFNLTGGIHVTRRELEVLALTAGGLENKVMSQKLGITSQSISNYLSNIVRKLGAKSSAHAVVVAVQNGMMVIDPAKDLVGWSPDDYVCCMYCGKAFVLNEAIEVKQKPFVVNHVKYDPPPKMVCPYEGCEGYALDAWSWSDIKKEHPEYPKIPERDVVYPYI